MHTPGPWIFAGARPASDARGVNGPSGVNLWGRPFAGDAPAVEIEGAANAALIAAAPELLALCEELLSIAKHESQDTPEMHALIAKAKGGAA